MSFFSRFRKAKPSEEPNEEPNSTEEVAADEAAADEAAEVDADDDFAAKEGPRDRAENGPWDASEEASEADRLDLGALKIPVYDQMQVQLEQTEDTREIVAVTLVHKGGNLQLQAFAASKAEGIWGDVRTQTAANIEQAGGSAAERYTEFGTELHAEVPVKLDGEDTPSLRSVHFIGIDGPRWFLRAALTNAAAEDSPASEELRKVVRGVIVDRGEEARPPRELLMLTPPNTEPKREESDDDDPLNPGPTIAEVR